MESEIVIDFYNRFSYEISCIRTMAQKNDVLSQMQEIFQEAVRNKPGIRDELSEIYQLLKIKCEHAA